ALDQAERSRWFTRRGAHWGLAPRFRAGVRFQYLNLAQDPFPDPEGRFTGLDLILCRNVLIYFDADLVRRVVRQFRDCLAPGGWLLPGHAEVADDLREGFGAVNTRVGFLLQKCPAASSASSMPTVAPDVLWRAPSVDDQPMVSVPIAQPPPVHSHVSR